MANSVVSRSVAHSYIPQEQSLSARIRELVIVTVVIVVGSCSTGGTIDGECVECMA